MLCLDDYFVVEVERVVTDPESGKKVKKMVIIIKLSFTKYRPLLGGGCLSVLLHYFF